MATSSLPVLATSRYTSPGTYIGQLIQPKPGNLTAEARICNYIGRGSRFAVGANLAIRRSFRFGEPLSFPTSAPFQSPLEHAADGNKTKPTRIFNSVTGLELLESQWDYVQDTNGNNIAVIISPAAFSQNARYNIDYQSTDRDVLDQLPVDNLREIQAIGLSPDRNQFTDFSDFFVPFSFTGFNANSANSHTVSSITSIFGDVANTGLGVLDIDNSASFDHNYNRFYQLTVQAITGGPGTYQATISWLSRPYSGGALSEPPVPLNSLDAEPTFTANEAVPTSLIADLELGLKVDIDFTGGQFSVGDKFYFNAVGPGQIEFDSRHFNTNQYLAFATINKSLEIAGSTGQLAYADNNTYTGILNSKFRVKCISASGGIGSRVATFVWAQYGDEIGASSNFVVTEGASVIGSLTQGVKVTVDFGAGNFIAGDEFDFEALPPRVFYQAKDDRVLNLSIGQATNVGADVGFVLLSFSTSTPEGGFGSKNVSMNLLSGSNKQNASFQLPSGVMGYVRNMIQGNVNGNSYAINDKFQGAVTSEDVIDWSLTSRVQETREITAFYVDSLGSVVGVAGMKYVILDNVYTPGSVLVNKISNNAAVSFIEIANSRFVGFVNDPGEAVIISYEYRGEEPSPGQLYYLTSTYLRPTSLYNNPTQILDVDDGRRFLQPAAADNHLYIMNEIAFDQGIQGAYYTQAFDADGDGIITRTDMQAALSAHEGVSRVTDLCILASSESLPDALQVNENANDPFAKREQMFWYGAPIGTPIGSIDISNSLVFLAKKTLQTSPTSPALGTRVLLAPTRAQKTIKLPNNLTQTIDLDGSFVAGATCALVNSFQDPATTILKRTQNSFDFIQTYSEPENLILGGASITYMADLGNSVYQYLEDITVHDVDETFQLISATTQKQYVTRVVRNALDSTSIGVVTPSAAAAVSLISGNLSITLTGLRSRGLIADWQDSAGNVRDFDPNSDILVTRDTSTLTTYNFLYAYWIRTPIKRLFGLFAVNTNDFGSSTVR